MKKIIKILCSLLLFNCANIYSPWGIKGEDVLKQINEQRYNISFISFPLLNSSSSYSGICSTDGITSVNPLLTPTSSANFSLPSEVNSFLDLNAPAGGGVAYFRSEKLSGSSLIELKVQSITTSSVNSAGTCAFSSSSFYCGNTDLSIITFNSDSALTSVSQDTCLFVKCDSPAVLRIRQIPDSTSFGISFATLEAEVLLRSQIEEVTFSNFVKIEKNKYYTRDSFEKCKDNISLITTIQANDLKDSAEKNKISASCNLPENSISSLTSPEGYSFLKANICKLEPVNFIGF